VARLWRIVFVALLGLTQPVLAGPPYLSDDPEPTDYKHYEIYTFGNGTATRDGRSGEMGIDFNYGAAPTCSSPSRCLPVSKGRMGAARVQV
jgi:hypothetical protein